MCLTKCPRGFLAQIITRKEFIFCISPRKSDTLSKKLSLILVVLSNEIWLRVVPCHRVIRADGSLCGYAGGPWRKRWLLDHERAHLARPSSP